MHPRGKLTTTRHPALRPPPLTVHRSWLSLPLVMLQNNLRLAICLLVLDVVAGCGGSGSGASAVSGHVTHKGKPLAKASVSFTPLEGETRAATGLTDDSGYYQLGTF